MTSRKLFFSVIVIVLLLQSHLGGLPVEAQSTVDVTYNTLVRQHKQIIVEFEVNNTFVGSFTMRTSPTLSRPSSIIIDSRWSTGRLEEALGPGYAISSVTILYDINKDNRSVARGALYHTSASINNIANLVRNPEELARYDVSELSIVAIISRYGKTVQVMTVDFLEEIKKDGVDKLFFIKTLEKHTLILNSELKDPGWIETDILRGATKIGRIRLVADPFFTDARLLYISFQLFEYEMVPFYKLYVNLTLGDSKEERYLGYELLPGEEMFLPSISTYSTLGLSEYQRAKSFNVTMLTLTLANPIDKHIINATGEVGVFTFKAVAGPTMVSNLELVESRELGKGWYYWGISLQTLRPLTNAEILFTPGANSIEPVYVKVVSSSRERIGDNTLLLDVLGLFDRIGEFDGNITLRTVLENYEILDYSVRVHSEVSQTFSENLETVDVGNVTGAHRTEALELDIHRRENLLRYGLVPAGEELEFMETLEAMKRELESIEPYYNYIEYVLPVERALGKYDFITISYNYELAPAISRGFEVVYEARIRDEGHHDPIKILGAAAADIPEINYWLSSFTGSRYFLGPAGKESLAIGYLEELYDENGKPVDWNTIENIRIRLYNARNANLSSIEVKIHRPTPPEIDFPSAYEEIIADEFEARQALSNNYSERGPPLWLLFVVALAIVSYQLVVAIRRASVR